MNEITIKETVRRCYLKYLNREPDQTGFEHFVTLMKDGQIDEKSLIDTFKNSPEYRLSHPVEIEPDTPVDIKMKKEWDARSKLDTLFVISTEHSENYEDFWQSGMDDIKSILDIDGSRFEKITHQKEPKKMRILEIGCGIGRLLIPMSEIFGQVIGVDISSEMIHKGKKHLENIQNCQIFENNGIDLSEFSDNYFDFCFSFIVFQHIPEKKIVEKYISEVSRVLKPNCLFRFQVRGTITSKPNQITTWDGVQFTSDEIHKIAQVNNFEIIEDGNDKDEYYWLTFQLKK
ncbi:MAG: methyltransferase domain-containing protein [Chloroflexota bacterium]|nr:methyltransferase domain-containing protein [Chloroflexota bacterium]